MSFRNLFFYGTLRDPDTRNVVLGPLAERISILPARLTGVRIHAVRHETYPIALPAEGHVAHGVVALDVPEEAVARISYFEDEFDYALDRRVVHLQDRRIEAELYLAHNEKLRADGDWDYERWLRDHQPAFVSAAREYMSHYGRRPAEHGDRIWTGIRHRALAAERAAEERIDRRLGAPLDASDVEILRDEQPYADFFTVRDYTLRHRQFDGGVSEPLDRAVWMAADAVTVLPWDPVSDNVLLLEQFRPAPLARGDAAPWLIEPVAGRIDGREPPEAAARREAEEEAGLTLGPMEEIAAYYPSPGIATEHVRSFVARADLSRHAEGIHGEVGEGEDIRTLILPLAEAEAALAQGEIRVGPLVMSLFWLRLHHERLRAAWA
ncbi:MAG: gamma-glutamylcyclotransferase [Rubricella sp.]